MHTHVSYQKKTKKTNYIINNLKQIKHQQKQQQKNNITKMYSRAENNNK